MPRNGADVAGQSLSDKAYAEILRMIVNLELAPGSALSEQQIATRLGIGRTPIREALRNLIREGLVTSYPSRGLVITDINQASQLRLLEVRRELDRLMARLAAERATPAEREAFRRIAAGMRASMEGEPDYAAFMELDKEFNSLMLASAKNEFAAKSTGLMNGLWARFWNAYYEVVADVPKVARLHAEIGEAIADKLPREAAEASDRLIDYITEFTRATLDH